MIALHKFSKVEAVQVLDAIGPWTSKSGGELSVVMSLDTTQLDAFKFYDNEEFDNIKNETNVDIRGLRMYRVANIAKGSIGANEYHIARTEIVSTLSGSVVWRCEDIYGSVSEFTVDSSKSLMIPYGIMHTYTALEDNTTVQGLCNTLYIPDIPGTHDSYSMDNFKQLQHEVANQ